MKRNTSSSVEQTEDDLLRTPKRVVDGWKDDPSPKDPLATRPAQPKAKKDTRRWCRGKVGREHTLAIVMDDRLSWTKTGCRWVTFGFWVRKGGGHLERRWHYSCHHIEVCTVCKKHFRSGWDLGEECPDFAPRPDVEVDERHPSG